MFSKTPEKAPVRPRKRTDKATGDHSTFSVIGTDVTITGNVAASTELHVDGRIEGDVACASLVQGEDSVIEGAITAETARLAGTLAGSIATRDLVVLQSAHVAGDVTYETLTIEQGAVIEGRLTPKDGQPVLAAPNEEGPGTGEPKLSLAT